MTTAAIAVWPKFKLQPHSPEEPSRIVSREEALRFGFDERDLDWLERGVIAGTQDPASFASLYLYTQADSIRAAAPEMLAELEFAQGVIDAVMRNAHPTTSEIHDALSRLARIIAKAKGGLA